jgi:hypothetical protein
METNIEQITSFLRSILGDTLRNGTDIFQYTTSNVFTLTESNAQSVESVSVNDVSSGILYTYEEDFQRVTITSSLITNDIIEMNYTFYSNYSDSELLGYIRHALGYVSLHQYANWSIKEDDNIYPTASDAELNLIAMIAAVIINPENRSIRTPDFSITVKNPMSISDMISKIIAVFKKSPSGFFTIAGREES